jgi:hypothetical protein
VARRVWAEAGETLVDLLAAETEDGPAPRDPDDDGAGGGVVVAHGCRLLRRVCGFEALRAGVARCEFRHEGRERSALAALRGVLRASRDPGALEDAAAALALLAGHGGIDQAGARVDERRAACVHCSVYCCVHRLGVLFVCCG